VAEVEENKKLKDKSTFLDTTYFQRLCLLR